MAVAPEVPAGGAFLVGLLALLVALGLLALRETVQVLIGSTLLKLAGLLPSVFGIRSTVQNGIDDAVNYVAAQLATWQLACDNTARRFFRDSETLVKDSYDALASFAGITAHAFHALTTSIIPGLIHDAISGVKTEVHNVTKQVTHITKRVYPETVKTVTTVKTVGATELHKLEARVAQIEAKLAQVVPAPVAKAVGTAEGELPKIIHNPIPEIRHWVDENLNSLRKEIDRLNKEAGIGVISGIAVAAVLKEFPHLNCQNNKTVGKALCRLPVKALEDLLLAGAIDVFTIVELCAILKHVTGLADNKAVQAGLNLLAEGIQDLLVCSGAEIAGPISVTVAQPGPVSGFATLAPVSG